MAVAPVQRAASGGYVTRAPRSSGLADVLEILLDRGLVIDAYVRISLVGIELLTVDLRVVIASVDTYLRFAEAVNRLDLAQNEVSKFQELQVERSEEPPTTEQELEGVDMASIKEVQKVADGLEQLVSELRSEIDNGADFERMTQIADEISEQADSTAQTFSSVNETLMSRINEVTGKSGSGSSGSSKSSSSKKTSKESA
jgi:gas vesicle structural protein